MNINSETHYHDGGKQVTYTLNTVTYEYLYLFLKHHLELNGTNVIEKESRHDKNGFPVGKQLTVELN